MFDWSNKDPEVERVVARLSEQLSKTEEWKPHDSGSVTHRIHNITASKDSITAPDHAWIPSRWKRTIKRHIRAIYRADEVSKLQFMYDVIDGEKYPYFVHSFNISKEIKEWLEENSTADQYMIIGNSSQRNGLYIKDPELAMGYKLTFEN